MYLISYAILVSLAYTFIEKHNSIDFEQPLQLYTQPVFQGA